MPPGKWPEDDNVHKISASALKSRGLATVTGHGRTWTAAITDAGTHYLEHGSYPPSDEPPVAIFSAGRSRRESPAKLELGEAASETLIEARVLIKHLQDQGQLTVSDPEESVRARYRRVLHACRVHHLVPDGQELRFTGRTSGDIVIMLSDWSPRRNHQLGPHSNDGANCHDKPRDTTQGIGDHVDPELGQRNASSARHRGRT